MDGNLFFKFGLVLLMGADRLSWQSDNVNFIDGFYIRLGEIQLTCFETISYELIHNRFGRSGPSDHPIVYSFGVDFLFGSGEDCYTLQHLPTDKIGPHAIFQVVTVVGDTVGDIGDLPFQRAILLVERSGQHLIVRASMFGQPEPGLIH